MPSLTWYINDDNPLFFAGWPAEDAVVVYQSSSGDTHLVNELGAAVLESLQASPATATTLFKRLYPSESLSNVAINKFSNNLLVNFEQLGLIEKTLS